MINKLIFVDICILIVFICNIIAPITAVGMVPVCIPIASAI